MNPYSYPATEPHFNLHLKETSRNWLHYTVDFPVAKPTNHQEHNTALGEYYQPVEGSNLPLAIIVHGWGDRSLAPCRLLAKDLAKRGIASVILYLVFHSTRMSAAIKRRLPHLTPDEWFEGYQTSVIDVQQIVDWAQTRQEINKEKIAVIGISLGGIISAIAMGVDKRINTGVILISGGNYENPDWLRKSGIRRTEQENLAAQQLFKQYLCDVESRGFENIEPPKRSYLTDPMTFASYLRGRPVLMINATLDERIPKQSSLDLWESAGKPAIKWLPGTHSSVWLLYPLIRNEILQFLGASSGK